MAHASIGCSTRIGAKKSQGGTRGRAKELGGEARFAESTVGADAKAGIAAAQKATGTHAE